MTSKKHAQTGTAFDGDQLQRWKDAIASQHHQQRAHRWRRNKTVNVQPGMVRWSPRSAEPSVDGGKTGDGQ